MSGREWEKFGEEWRGKRRGMKDGKEERGVRTYRELIGCGGCDSNYISREGAGSPMSNIGYR